MALLAVRADNGRGRFEANADCAVSVDIRAFDRNPANNIFGSHWSGRRFTGHGASLVLDVAHSVEEIKYLPAPSAIAARSLNRRQEDIARALAGRP